jgi:tetratricopeptide (TPR) repeat protein
VLLAGACSRPEDIASEALKSGDSYYAQQKFREAIVEYNRAVKANPLFGQARLRLAEALIEANDLANGFKEYYRAADLLPGNLDVQIKAAGFLLLQRRFEDAQARARTILTRDPKNVDAQLLLANALAGAKDFDAALAQIEEAIKLDPDRASTYQNLGDFQLANDKAVAAEAAYRKAVELEPDSVRSRLALAAFYWAANRTADAERELKETVTRSPNSLPAHRVLALFLITHDRAKDADASLQAMARLSTDPASQLMLSDYYIAARRTDDAAKLLEPLAQNARTAAAAKLRLAALQMQQGHRDVATRLVDEAITAAPRSGEARLMKARLLVEGRRLPEAQVQAKLATEILPNSDIAHALLGAIALELNDTATAQKELARALELNPKAAGTQLALGILELTRGDVNQATQYAQNAAGTSPNSPTLRLFLARMLITKGDLGKAAEELTALRSKYPKSANVQATYGALRALQHDEAGARQAFEAAVAIEPLHLEALTGLTTLDMVAKRPQQASDRLNRVLEQAPSNVPILLLAARVNGATGDVARAEALLKRVLAADADRLDAYAMLAQIYAGQHRLPEARAELRKVLDRRPNSVATRTMLGILAELDGARDAARVEYEGALAVDKSTPIAANNLANILLDGDETLDRALELATVAKGKLPDDPQINDTLGWAFYKNNRMPEAVQALEDSVAKNDKSATSLYHLGMAYQKNGNLDLARKTMQRAVALKPELKNQPEVQATL